MSGQLLFVCTANVCRSPLMALTFAELVSQQADQAEWTVSSAGIRVVRPHPMCALAGSLLSADGESPARVSSHVSKQVLDSDVERQDVIIVASREERARLARMLPSSRTRTFTLREAVALGTPLDVAYGSKRDDPGDGGGTLADYAAFLHARRGRVRIPPVARGLLPWVPPADPYDIPDVHHETGKKHATTLRQIRELIRTLHVQVQSFLEER